MPFCMEVADSELYRKHITNLPYHENTTNLALKSAMSAYFFKINPAYANPSYSVPSG